jgi:hypothetical protein
MLSIWLSSSLLAPSQPPHYDRIGIIICHCRREVHEIKYYNHALSRTNTPTWDDVSNQSNISFLSVHLLIWKPVACLKSVTFLKNCSCPFLWCALALSVICYYSSAASQMPVLLSMTLMIPSQLISELGKCQQIKWTSTGAQHTPR